MHYVQDNNLIAISRGDFVKIPIKITRGEFPFEIEYKLEGKDIIVFALMKPTDDFNTAFFKKILTKDDYDIEDNLYIRIQPEDTILLNKGTYYYEVRVLFEDKKYNPKGELIESDVVIDTVIPKTKFTIL